MSKLVTISSSYTAGGKRKRRRGASSHPLESDEQKAAWDFLGHVSVATDVSRRPLQDFAYMVPNGTQLGGTRVRRAQYMASLKAQGFRNGVSDLVIAYPVGDFHGAYVEMKRARAAYPTPSALAGAATKDQKDWLRLMASVGYWTCIAFGATEFTEVVNSYLRGEPPLALPP